MQRLLADAEKLSGKSYDIQNLNDVYDAIHVIQTDLDITGTTAKEAASTLSGSFASMKSAAQNMMGNLVMGREIESSMINLANSAATFLFNNLVPALGRIIISLPQVLGAVIYTIIPQIGAKISEVVPQTVTWINKKLPVLVTTGGKMLAELAKGFGNKLPQLTVTTVKMIGKLAVAIIKQLPTIVKVGTKILLGFRDGLLNGASGYMNAAGNKIKNAFLAPIERMKERVQAIIAKIKGFFSFTTSTPNIKMPHFSITPSGWKVKDLLTGTIPKLGVNWYATGGIATGPAIAGVGEAGDEAIVPLDKFWNKLDSIAQQSAGVLNVVIKLDGETIGKSTVEYLNGQTIMFGTNPLMI